MSTTEQMADALADFGVHIGFPQQMREMAAGLINAGFTHDEVLALGAHIEQTVVAGSALNVLFAALNGDRIELRARISGVVRYQQAKAQRNAPTPQPYPGEVDHQRITPEDSARFARLDEARQARMAYCRAIADRVDRDTVAKEIGVPVALLDGLIQKGFEMQGGRGEMPSGKPVPKRRREVKK